MTQSPHQNKHISIAIWTACCVITQPLHHTLMLSHAHTHTSFYRPSSKKTRLNNCLLILNRQSPLSSQRGPKTLHTLLFEGGRWVAHRVLLATPNPLTVTTNPPWQYPNGVWSFFTARCPSCRPTNSIKAQKEKYLTHNTQQHKHTLSVFRYITQKYIFLNKLNEFLQAHLFQTLL